MQSGVVPVSISLERRPDGGDIGSLERAECAGLVAACAELGVYEADRILFVSDGAHAIHWIRRRAFPDAIELLDWYHLTERLRWGTGAAHGEVLSTALGAAAPGDVDALLAILRAYARAIAAGDPGQAEHCRGLIGHVTDDRRGIADCRIVPLASSGPMEKAVDIVVCRRFKTRGMSWFRKGVGHLLHPRLLRLNRRWDRHWAGRSAACRLAWPSRPDPSQKIGCFPTPMHEDPVRRIPIGLLGEGYERGPAPLAGLGHAG